MPQEKNTTLRVVLPTLAVIGALLIAVAFYINTQNKPNPSPVAATTPAATQPGGQAAVKPAPAQAPAQQAPVPQAVNTPVPAVATTVGVPQAALPQAAELAVAIPADLTLGAVPTEADISTLTLGGLDPAGNKELQLTFSKVGAGVAELRLAKHFDSIKEDTHTLLQSEHAVPMADGNVVAITPFSALAVEVTLPGRTPIVVPLAGAVWSPIEGRPGTFEARIVDNRGEMVLRVEREYRVTDKSYVVGIYQRVENHSLWPMSIRWFQMGPIDLPPEASSYGGDKRRVRFAYMLPANIDPSQATVMGSDFVLERGEVLGKKASVQSAGGSVVQAFQDETVWPNETSTEGQYALTWAGTTSRYFGVAVHPMVSPAAIGADKTLRWVGGVSRVVLDAGTTQHMGLRLESLPITLTPRGSAGDSVSLSHGAYSGPLNRRDIRLDPLLKSLNVAGLVVYNFGGMCGFCTFPFLTSLLLWLLHALHDIIFQDWSLAIIFLVVVVRTVLHPVTRWSQIRMARFGKQMQGIAPKQKALQDKYKGEPQKLQQETARLWREEGISPAGLLGCLPAVLQMPVWIALYATLYFAAELRHQPAFYGLFQSIQPPASPLWYFLGDLAEPDRFWYFGKTLFTLPLLGEINSVNVLPLVLAVVFYVQQKYMTPPTSVTMTPEQELQQKMVKWMMVILFPLFMYAAPSGLALYFLTNSTLAIFESKWIRAHMETHGLLDLDKMKAEREARRARKPGSPAAGGGFMEKLMAMAEQKRLEAERARTGGKKPANKTLGNKNPGNNKGPGTKGR